MKILPTHIIRIQFELQEAGITFTAKAATTEKDFINENETEDLLSDLILSDYDLPKYSGALSFTVARRRCPDTPFILVTIAVSEDLSIENTQKRHGWKSQRRH